MLASPTWLGVLLLGWQLGAGTASAPPNGADDLNARGLELRRQGKDQDALPLFQQALEQNKTPKAAAQAGLCEQALGLWLPAETHLQDALAQPTDPWINKNEAALHDSLKAVQAHVGAIELWGTPAGARISVDGQPRGTLPVPHPARVPEGRRVVAVEASGFVTEKRTIEVVGGALVREHVALMPGATIATPTAAPPPTAAGTDLQTAAPHVAEAPADGSHRRWWLWAVLGGVAIAGGVSAYFLFRSSDKCQAPAGGVCGSF